MEQKSEVMSRRLTCTHVGLSIATIWRMEKMGNFPRRVQLSSGRVGYFRKDVDDWLANRPRIKY